MLEIENPERKIEVINAGISGGNSKTELELIGSKIINYDPDLIIMYDGWNDLSTDYPVLKIINHYEGICSLAIENNFEVILKSCFSKMPENNISKGETPAQGPRKAQKETLAPEKKKKKKKMTPNFGS